MCSCILEWKRSITFKTLTLISTPSLNQEQVRLGGGRWKGSGCHYLCVSWWATHCWTSVDWKRRWALSAVPSLPPCLCPSCAVSLAKSLLGSEGISPPYNVCLTPRGVDPGDRDCLRSPSVSLSEASSMGWERRFWMRDLSKWSWKKPLRHVTPYTPTWSWSKRNRQKEKKNLFTEVSGY